MLLVLAFLEPDEFIL